MTEMGTHGMWIELSEFYYSIANETQREQFKYMTTGVYTLLEELSLIKMSFECFPQDGRVVYNSSGPEAERCAIELLKFIDNCATLIMGLPNNVCIATKE